MKLQVALLTRACDAVITQHKHRLASESEARAELNQQYTDEWFEENASVFRASARVINTKLRKREPVIYADIAPMYQRHYRQLPEGAPFEYEGVRYGSDKDLYEYTQAQALRSFLEVIAGDTVTLADLRSSKFSLELIGRLITLAQGFDGEASEPTLT